MRFDSLKLNITAMILAFISFGISIIFHSIIFVGMGWLFVFVQLLSFLIKD